MILIIAFSIFLAPFEVLISTAKSAVYSTTESKRLQGAISDKNVASVQKHLRQGADPNATYHGRAPLHWVITEGVSSETVSIVDALLKHKADPNILDNTFASPLHRLTGQGGNAHTISIAKLLIAKGAHLNRMDGYGETPLIKAIESENLELVNLLLDHGADPNRSARNGDIPLLNATKKRNPKLVNLLLVHGADPNRKSARNGRTPLIRAIKGGNADVVKVLLDNGADPTFGGVSVEDGWYHSDRRPIDLVIKLKKTNMIPLLCKKLYDISDDQFMCEFSYNKVICDRSTYILNSVLFGGFFTAIKNNLGYISKVRRGCGFAGKIFCKYVDDRKKNIRCEDNEVYSLLNSIIHGSNRKKGREENESESQTPEKRNILK